jgi:hypothetical protein
VLSQAETEALCELAPTPLEATEPQAAAEEDREEADEESETQSPDDDEASEHLGDWRAARARVGATRIPPRRPQAA